MTISVLTEGGEEQEYGLMWYGKIPASGDFVQRRMLTPLLSRWERWFSLGISQMGRGSNRSCSRVSSLGPIWGFAMPAVLGAGWVQLGCVMLSHDRVGRDYPLCVIWTISPQQAQLLRLPAVVPLLEQAGSYLQGAVLHRWDLLRLDSALHALSPQLKNAFEPAIRPTISTPLAHQASRDILDVLYGEAISTAPLPPLWQAIGQHIDPHSNSSFWWALETQNQGWRSLIHGGELSAALFRQLFHSGLSATDRLRPSGGGF